MIALRLIFLSVIIILKCADKDQISAAGFHNFTQVIMRPPISKHGCVLAYWWPHVGVHLQPWIKTLTRRRLHFRTTPILHIQPIWYQDQI